MIAKFNVKLFAVLLGWTIGIALSVSSSNAGEQSDRAWSVTGSATSTRYGLFDALDHRSEYGQGTFPEPFLVDESELEQNEFRLDWLHTKAGSQYTDLVTAEVEKGFGLLTVELEIPIERDSGLDRTKKGVGNISLGGRYPVFQYVSGSGLVDSTFGAAIEGGIPTESAVSKNGEVVPKLFNDLRIGDHFSVQSIVGYSMRFGSEEEGGLHAFEYGFVFGYSIPRDEMQLPGVEQFTPVFELKGETQLNKENSGQNSVLGDLGLRVDLKAVGQLQPRLGVGFVFPIDKGGRENLHWGVITSLAFHY